MSLVEVDRWEGTVSQVTEEVPPTPPVWEQLGELMAMAMLMAVAAMVPAMVKPPERRG